jgi:3-methyladenine DNA glycosylase AlkD
MKGSMTLKDALKELKALGNEKVRAMHVKNGAVQELFGVKMGDIRNVAKKIKTDHKLALELWKTENIDAQLLALLVIDPKQLTLKELDEMAGLIRFGWVSDWFASYVLKDHPEKDKLREKWMRSKDPWKARLGWSLMAGRVTREAEGLDLEEILSELEKKMPKADPAVQWTMNNTLAAIGINHPRLRTRAVAIGEKLGIYKDYPVSKGCTSPFAPVWINEMVKRQKEEA